MRLPALASPSASYVEGVDWVIVLSDTNIGPDADADADAAAEYRILGPLEVVRNGDLAQLRGRGPRVLLCALLLNRNQAVSVDRLIEVLWGGRAPPTATKTVQVYVSHLRKALAALGGAAEHQLQTHGHSYLLRVEPGQLDVDRFQALVEQGRELRAAGDAAAAASHLEDALALWRGPALADLAYEEAAREEIAQLDEQRIAAVEERIDADLDCGRHADLIPELQRLVGQHPTRERLHGQLMVALYRSGRQTEAINAYADARRALSEQLGIDPGAELRDLERRILNHDPTLTPPPSAPARPASATPRRWLLLAGAALLLAAAVAAAATEITSGGSRSGIATLAGDSVGLIDPASGRIIAQFPLGTAPTQVVADTNAVWTLNVNDATIARADLATGASHRVGIGATPVAMALGAGSIWVSYATAGGQGPYGVLRFDPDTLAPRGHTIIDPRASWSGQTLPLVATADAVWVAAPGRLFRIDPASGKVTLTVPLSAPRLGSNTLASLAELRDTIWAQTDTGSIVQIDERSGAVTRAGRLPLVGPIAAGGGSLWIADPLYGRVWRFDPQPPHRAHYITTGLNASGIAYGDGGVWVTSAIDGTLVRIDPATEHTRRFPLGSTPTAVTVSPPGVLVTTIGGGAGTAAGSHAPTGGGINADACGRVIYAGPGRPRFLIAADLNLSDGISAPYTQGMAQAIQYELRTHHFTAGHYRLGLQICDDSTPQSGGHIDPVTCAANAKAYAATATVIGVIGPVESVCAFSQVPLLNRAGPLAMVSIGTNPALTIHEPGTPLKSLYPTGTRNFVRVTPRDDLQAVAGAELAKRLGLHRVYVWLEYPSDSLGSTMAPAFAHAARRLGIHVIGPASPGRGFQRLARRLAARGVDGVFVAGYAPFWVGHRSIDFIHAMRAQLGGKVTLIGPKDGFWLPPDAPAGQRVAQSGMYLVGADLSAPDRQLPPAGRAFTEAFRSSPPVGASNLWAPYAAQATDMLLAAIARSDGTRPSVVHELFRTRITDGILGNFTVSPTGDLNPNLVIIDRTTPQPPGTKPVTTIRVPPGAN